jgi:hypothetical protein
MAKRAPVARRRPGNLTVRVDDDVVLWARMRALRERTTVGTKVRAWLEEYAQVPRGWWEGLPPPWDEAEGERS